MRTLSLPQPWATLLSRGRVRFAVREQATTFRGTIAIHASPLVDHEVLARLESDAEFTERLAAEGLQTESDINALPRNAVVGVAVIADLWSLESIEEVATEDDAVWLGDVAENAIFWELAEAVAIDPIDYVVDAGSDDDTVDDSAGDSADDEGNIEDNIEDNDDVDDDLPSEKPARTAIEDLELDDTQAAQVRAAVLAEGALFDADDLVYWPVKASETLATLIGNDAVGDREITRRVWAYVVEQDLQDPEDPAYVYLDDALRAALQVNVEGLPTIDFTDRVIAQIVRES